jgi:DNA-binding protein
MNAPPRIIDALESIMDIYFSGVRHRERTAFILCDNLIEITCKTRAKEINNKFDMRSEFRNAINAQGVKLQTVQLGSRVIGYRDTRNNMQHSDIAATVDGQYCATAIIDAVKVIDHCWQNTSKKQFSPWMRCALRIIRLYSSEGDASKRYSFERKMQQMRWRISDRESVKANSIQIEPGFRDYWWLAIRMRTPQVEECLNEFEIQ